MTEEKFPKLSSILEDFKKVAEDSLATGDNRNFFKSMADHVDKIIILADTDPRNAAIKLNAMSSAINMMACFPSQNEPFHVGEPETAGSVYAAYGQKLQDAYGEMTRSYS